MVALLYLELGDEVEAETGINLALELALKGVFSNWAKEMLLLTQGENAQAREYANNVLQQDARWAPSLAELSNQDLQARHFDDAKLRYKNQFPMLFDNDDPKIDRVNVEAAINLALIMTRLGQPMKAHLLLQKCLEYAESTSLPRAHWYTIAYGLPLKVKIYALLGETQKSLQALKQAIDNNWRGLWRYRLDHDPKLDSIRHEPEFKAMVEEIKTDMAAQLERIRKKDK